MRLAGSRTPVEEHMLQQQGDVAVVLLRFAYVLGVVGLCVRGLCSPPFPNRPREKVTIPFKFQSFSAGSLARWGGRRAACGVIPPILTSSTCLTSLDHELRQQSGGQTAQAAEALLGELPGDPVLRRTIRVGKGGGGVCIGECAQPR